MVIPDPAMLSLRQGHAGGLFTLAFLAEAPRVGQGWGRKAVLGESMLCPRHS